MTGAFDPYYKWLGIPPAEQPAHHYRLLGIAIFEVDAEVIEAAADRQMAHVRTFQSGPHSAESQKLLNELAAARVCLLDRSKKAHCDAELRQRLEIMQTPAPLAPGPIVVQARAISATGAPASSAVVIDPRRPKAGPALARRRAPAVWVAGATALLAAVLAGAFISAHSKTATAIRPPAPQVQRTSPPEIIEPQPRSQEKQLQVTPAVAPQPANFEPPEQDAPGEASEPFGPEQMPVEEPRADESPAEQRAPESVDASEPSEPEPAVENSGSDEAVEAAPVEKPKRAAGEVKRPRVSASGRLPAASDAGLPPGVRLLRDIKYGRQGNGQTLDLYLPMKFASAVPLVIWIHGGGWESGNKQPPWPAIFLIDKGYAVASVNYRLTSEAKFPAQIHDCKAAVRWLRANAKRHGIDPERFGVWGESAGGHLAALVGVSAGVEDLGGAEGENLKLNSHVQAVCDCCGPTDLERLSQFRASHRGLSEDYPKQAITKLLGGPVEETRGLAERANPVLFVSGQSPPFLIVHGAQDRLVPFEQSELLHRALTNAGAEAELVVVPQKGHERFDDLAGLRRVETFFNRTLWGADDAQAAKDVRLIATYTHRPGKLPPRAVEFYSNGRLDLPESPNTWMIRGNQLVLCWYTAQAKPFGIYIDTCNLSKDGKYYQGLSLAGAPINGEKISGDHLKSANRFKGPK